MSESNFTDDAGRQNRFSLTSSLKSVFRAFFTSLSLVQDVRVILPVVLYFALQIAVMMLYLSGISEPWLSFWGFIAGGRTGLGLGHFPQHLLMMPHVLGRFDILMDVLVHSLIQAATVVLVAASFRKHPVSLKESIIAPLKRYPHLFAVALVSSAAVFAVVNLSDRMSSSVMGPGGAAAAAAGIAGGLVIQALFLFAVPIIMLAELPFARMLSENFRAFWRTPLLSLLVVAIPFAITMPTMLLSLKADVIAIRLAPKFMIHNHIASSFMEMISTYLISAGAVILYIRRRDPSAGR